MISATVIIKGHFAQIDLLAKVAQIDTANKVLILGTMQQ